MLLIVSALRSELQSLAKCDWPQGEALPTPSVNVQRWETPQGTIGAASTGTCRDSIERAMVDIDVTQSPSAYLSIGFAVSLNGALKAGDICIASKVLGENGVEVIPHPEDVELAMTAGQWTSREVSVVAGDDVSCLTWGVDQIGLLAQRFATPWVDVRVIVGAPGEISLGELTAFDEASGLEKLINRLVNSHRNRLIEESQRRFAEVVKAIVSKM